MNIDFEKIGRSLTDSLFNTLKRLREMTLSDVSAYATIVATVIAVAALMLSYVAYRQSLDAQHAADQAARRERIERQNNLITIGTELAGSVVAACDSFTATFKRGETPDYTKGDDPTSKAMIAFNALKAIGSTGTDDPALVYDMSKLTLLVNPDRFNNVGLVPDDRATAYDKLAAPIREAIKAVNAHRLPQIP